ncbi:MAG: N-acetylmuramoyl-L-alanine amidase, partial [Finegoldia magna]|nr:N-acetylmuramoyl-L-alanine amidase [Finegoldia magna]
TIISSEYDEKLKQNGFKVTRNGYKSVYDANYVQNSDIKYSKIIFTEYKDIRTSLLASYVSLQKNYVNILVNEGNVDKTTNKLLTTSVQNGVYIGKKEENFEKLANKLDLYYKVEQK